MNRILPLMDLSNSGDTEIQITCVSNLYFKRMHFKKAGDVEYGHSHPFDHVSFLSFGSAKVTVSGKSKVFYAPQVIFIKKDLKHELEALEDNTEVTCIHAIRNGERVEDIIDPESYVIPPGAEGIEKILEDNLIKHIVTSPKE